MRHRAIYSAAIDDARTDAELVSAAQAGHRDAADILLRRHHDRLYGLCRRLTGNDTDAADACQEALIAIVRGLGRFDGRAQFSTWAHRVATNACLDELRRRRRRPVPGLPDDLGTTTEPSVAGVGGGAPSGGMVAERIDLDSAMLLLAHDFRVAVVLRDQCGMAYEDIADVVGVPMGTVRSRISRGRALLADRLGAGYRTGGGGRTTSGQAGREPATVLPTSKGKHDSPSTVGNASPMTNPPNTIEDRQ